MRRRIVEEVANASLICSARELSGLGHSIYNEIREVIARSREMVSQSQRLLQALDQLESRESSRKEPGARKRSPGSGTSAASAIVLSQSEFLHMQAMRCRRLAQSIKEPEVERFLSQMALEFEERVAALETGSCCHEFVA